MQFKTRKPLKCVKKLQEEVAYHQQCQALWSQIKSLTNLPFTPERFIILQALNNSLTRAKGKL